jgi:SsrA-binding protein
LRLANFCVNIRKMSAKSKNDENAGQAAINKKAYHNFELVEKYEAGLSLLGGEVKSLRCGGADLTGSYGRIDGDECWLVGATISPYQQAGLIEYQPTRKRKILLHKNEIHKIKDKLELRGFTLVPLRIYFNKRGFAKIELALARGKRQYDKRRTISDKQYKKDIDRDSKKYR